VGGSPRGGELRERARGERARLDPLDPERREPGPQLPRGLVGEGHREDLRRLERTTPHLAREAVRDRGGGAGPRAGQDRDRPSERERRLTLGLVQAGEDALELGHRSDPNTTEGRTYAASPHKSP